jgi:hypothetical protein
MGTMRAMLASDPGARTWPNEDFAAVAPGAAVLLDGATTVPRDRDIGCTHGVAWFARNLGGTLLAAITGEPRLPLDRALAEAIATVRDRHAGSCDLTVPATPAATVTAVRLAGDGVDYLALSDSSVLADLGEDAAPVVITDIARAAGPDPGVALKARTGSLPLAGLRGIALLSDGATRITDRYALLGWPDLARVLREQGPAELIRQVRAAEDSDPEARRWRRRKLQDDATIVHWPLD